MSDSRKAWSVAWLGGVIIGVMNGVARESTYGARVAQRAAHAISALTGVVAFAGYFAVLQRHWPLRSQHDARVIGVRWLALTIVFEFAFGRLVAKQSWRELLADYNVAKGRTWPFVLGWIAIGPAVIRRLQGNSDGRGEGRQRPLG